MLAAQTADSDGELAEHTQLQKEFSFDTVIVFGQGPVKPVLLESEITPAQLKKWQAYKVDPTHASEPGFWLMQQPRYLAELDKISQDKELTVEEKVIRKEAIRQRWQRTGWFAMKHWCRQNALAAGLALYKGLTKRIILSGGKTIKLTFSDLLPKVRIANWPSEAELMADTIRSTYGDLYLKKYGHSIDEKILLEDSSTNTLENFACTVNKYPELLNEDVKVGFLAVEHHLDRVTMFGKLFLLQGGKICAQDLLKALKVGTELEGNKNQDFIKETEVFAEDRELVSQEKRWRRGIQEPEYLTYWLGFVAMAKHPRILQNIMKRFEDPRWTPVAEKAFAEVGLKLSDYREKDLIKLAKTDSLRFNSLIQKLQELRKPEYRSCPPAIFE